MSKEVKIGKHPLFIFLKEYLKLNLSEFSLLTGIPQSTVSTWILRERSIESLPGYFFVSLSNLGDLPLDDVYNTLVRLESEYLVNQVQNQRYFSSDEELLVDKVKKEAYALKADIRGKEKEVKVLSVIKSLKLAKGKKSKNEFMSVLIEFYSRVERTLPGWITVMYEDEDAFVEISVTYVSILSEKNKK